MKIRIKMRSKIQAGPGIEVANADANTVISAKGNGVLTQPEFDAMLANAWSLIETEISSGALNAAVYNVSTFGAQDYIDTTYGNETVEVCGVGSITVLTV